MTLTSVTGTNDNNECIETENPIVLVKTEQIHLPTESVLEHREDNFHKLQALEAVPLAAVAVYSTHSDNFDPQKTRTPSPNSSLDDIVLASEIMDTLSERKEPNGKIYFVNELRQDNTAPGMPDLLFTTAEEKEEKSAIDLLDDVIKNEDVELETSTVAVIHHKVDDDEDQSEKVDLVEQSEIADNMSEVIEVTKKDSPSEILEVLQEQITLSDNLKNMDELKVVEAVPAPVSNPNVEQLVKSNANLTDSDKEFDEKSNESDTHTIPYIPPADYDTPKTSPIQTSEEAELTAQTIMPSVTNDDGVNSVQFKERLTMLLGQNRFLETPKRQKSKLNNANIKTESDINQQIMAEIRSRSMLRQRSETPRSLLSITPAPQADIPTNYEDITPPPPPVFDPVLYHALGRSKSIVVASKITDETDEDSDASSVTANAIKSTEQFRRANIDPHNDEENRASRMSAIRGKLENILRRGPPILYGRPKTMSEFQDVTVIPKSPQTPITENKGSEATVDDQEVMHYKEPKKPFDTVHKQKLLFNDVLKSISPEVRPGLVRSTSSTASMSKKIRPNTIQDARNELKPLA